MMLLIDNYDSFTYNLVQYLAGLGGEIRVVRNDALDVAAIAGMKPDSIVISPGPCTPTEAGVSVACVQEFSGTIPILGVCLGHQSIGVAFGGTITHAGAIMHGKTSMIGYEDGALYRDLPNPFPAARYHSLAVARDSLPADLVVDATSPDGEIMGMHHRAHPTYGVQFHPESILTPDGMQLLRNFLNRAAEFRSA